MRLKNFFGCLSVAAAFLGIVLAIVVSYKIRQDIRIGYPTIDGLVSGTFLPLIFLNLIFGGEFVFSKFIFDKNIVFFKGIIIFFTVQFLIGAILLIPHLGYWIDYFRNYGNVQFMMPKHQVDFLISSLYLLDSEIGLCLIVSSIIFFVQLYKKMRQ